MSDEDEMVQFLMHYYNHDVPLLEEYDYTFEVEAHYNHYGDRGVADLYVQERAGRYRSDYIFEIKADSAVKEATGANEIVRQFNRLRRYFYEDEDRDLPTSYQFELVFVPSHTAVNHVAENLSIYQSLQENDLGPTVESQIDSGAKVLFRHPEEGGMTPSHVNHPLGDCDTPSEWRAAIEDAQESVTRRKVADYLKNLGH